MKLHKVSSAIVAGAVLFAAVPTVPVLASSHMDAPMITLDDPANTTDVYAFRSQSDDKQTQYLTTALSVYPFEEPGIGPNNYRFDDNVLYEIHVALGSDVASGRASISYQFKFDTKFANEDTILQSYLGVVGAVAPGSKAFDDNQNLRQTYTVTMVDRRSSNKGKRTVLATGLTVPPNNQGLLTPFYNQGNNGENPAKEGVLQSQGEAALDAYTKGAIFDIDRGYRAFAGQRDDGFYADIQAIFDADFAFSGPNKPFDSQGGFNLHTIALNIPLDELNGAKVAGVYATTSRRKVEILRNERNAVSFGPFVQVGRQGNPLFAEALVRIRDKDLYNITPPTRDKQLFSEHASDPVLAAVLRTTPVVDLVALFIPDLIKVDLTTGPARLANESGFDRLSGVIAVLTEKLEGADVLINEDGQTVFGGWPNGRRFGDDVVDIAIAALGAVDVTAEVDGEPVEVDVDRVKQNDITYNDVFPYAATPLNGRNHPHHGESNSALTN